MKKNRYLKILTGIVTFLLLLIFFTTLIVEPWIGKKLEAEINEKAKDYIVEIDKVHISVFKSRIVLDSITIYSKEEHAGVRDLQGHITSIKISGIKMMKYLFKNEIQISDITILNSRVNGKIPFQVKNKPPVISPLNIRIERILLDKVNFAIVSTLNSQAYSVKDGLFKVYDLQIEKQDTVTSGIVKNADFESEEFMAVSSDSMYTFKAGGILCSVALNTLMADSISIHPNYSEYDFTSRHKYETDRIEAGFSKIFAHDFSTSDYIKSGKMVSSYIEIGKMDLKVFRDKRKIIHHVKKPAFQDMIYNYRGTINIDSIGLLSGNVTYTEHAEKANDPGSISFNELNAKIYKITNDTVYKTEKGYLKLNAEAMLMGKGKMSVLLKGRLFERDNTFSVNGTLSGMKAKDLNPMLEKNAFIYATSGTIDNMNFSFTANNTRSTGKMILLYHGLDIAVKNKRTDDTIAIKERLTSIVANIKVLNSNPIQKQAVREGIIDYERDPERFLFHYCAKSIISGIKSSLVKSPKKK